MGWIVMARDECGNETRASDNEWSNEDDAWSEASRIRERYPEKRPVWVEMLRDKDYYLDYYLDMYDQDREEW
jgi:hypothetical protein